MTDRPQDQKIIFDHGCRDDHVPCQRGSGIYHLWKHLGSLHAIRLQVPDRRVQWHWCALRYNCQFSVPYKVLVRRRNGRHRSPGTNTIIRKKGIRARLGIGHEMRSKPGWRKHQRRSSSLLFFQWIDSTNGHECTACRHRIHDTFVTINWMFIVTWSR